MTNDTPVWAGMYVTSVTLAGSRRPHRRCNRRVATAMLANIGWQELSDNRQMHTHKAAGG